MERIRLLTTENIKQFIEDNREYYIKLRQETEMKKKVSKIIHGVGLILLKRKISRIFYMSDNFTLRDRTV